MDVFTAMQMDHVWYVLMDIGSINNPLLASLVAPTIVLSVQLMERNVTNVTLDSHYRQ